MQDLIEVNGIVLSAQPAGESDRRLLMLTKELGKISAFARGSRKPTSAMVGSTRPFAFGKFYIYPGRDSYSVHRAEISEYFEPVFLDVEKSAYGCYFLELSGYFTRENMDGGETLTLLFYTLKALLKEGIPDPLIRRVFELKLLSMNGLVPDFSVCRKCGKPLTEGWFLPSLTGTVCPECGSVKKGIFLTKSALYTLNFIRETGISRLYTFNVNEETFRMVSSVTESLFSQSIDRSLPSREMLFVLTENA